MTVTQRKSQHIPDEVQTVNEPGEQYECDACACDLTHTIRIKCADPVCTRDEGVDICPACFCAGKEFKDHKRWHSYRVIELNSYPIFTEDWGADEELHLITGLAQHGVGNWKRISEYLGTRTKEEIEKHYESVYIDSPEWPLPRVDPHLSVDPDEFQERKRRRIAEMSSVTAPTQKVAPTSAPGVHEVASFLPGRLEFEHENDNDAEDRVKDLEFGICLEWGGDQILEDEFDPDVQDRLKIAEERINGFLISGASKTLPAGKGPPAPQTNGSMNGYHINGDVKRDVKSEDAAMANGSNEEEEEVEEPTRPPPYETKDSLKFKLTLLEEYSQRVEKRHQDKSLMFERGLLEYKKIQAADKKKGKEEREILHRLRPFARLQTAEDYESFSADILYEAILRKRIQELQHYRRLGLSTAADIDKYENNLAKRTQVKVQARDYDRSQYRSSGRQSSGPDPRRSSLVSYCESDDRSREPTPRLPGTAPSVRRPPPPLNLANSPSLHLLTPAEQTLCSQLRILPKPYLVVKETLVREYARRGGKLRRREARDLVKIDVNKTSRIWDFLVQAGFLKITTDTASHSAPAAASGPQDASLQSSSVNGSPSKSPRPPLPPAIASVSSASSSVNGSLYSSSQHVPQPAWPLNPT